MIPATLPASVMDPEAASLAGVYAEALLDLEPDDDRAEELYAELAALVELIESIPKAGLLLSMARLDADEREQLIRRVFAGRVSERLEGFLAVLARHGRMDLLAAVVRAVRRQLSEREGRLEVTVITAQPLSDEMRSEIERTLGETLQGRLDLSARVEPDLLGGLVVQVGDRVFDASVASRLEQFKQQFRSRIGRRFGADEENDPTP